MEYICEYLHQSVPVHKENLKRIRLTGARLLTSDEAFSQYKREIKTKKNSWTSKNERQRDKTKKNSQKKGVKPKVRKLIVIKEKDPEEYPAK